MVGKFSAKVGIAVIWFCPCSIINLRRLGRWAKVGGDLKVANAVFRSGILG